MSKYYSELVIVIIFSNYNLIYNVLPRNDVDKSEHFRQCINTQLFARNVGGPNNIR